MLSLFIHLFIHLIIYLFIYLFIYVIYAIYVILDPLPGNYTFTGVFAFHSSDGTARQDCGEIDTQNAVIYFEAFRYAINYINSLKLTPYKIGYYVFDTCDSSLKLKSIIKEQCLQQYYRSLIALVGPSNSDEALEMSAVFNIWGINTISYAAASPLFDDRSRHKKFLRTVPSDSYQISAVIDVIRHFNWTYIVALSSCSNYEQKVLNTFDAAMHEDKRCLARKSILPCVRKDASYERELAIILKDIKVRVVVMFTSKDDTIGILKAGNKLNMQPGRLTWLGSTGWGNLNLQSYGLETIGLGALTLVNSAPNPVDDFKKHLFSLNPSNTNYTYFTEYWQALFNCSLPGEPNTKKRSMCTGKEKLTDGVGWYRYTTVQPVFDAVLAAFRGFYRIMPKCPARLTMLGVCKPHAILQAMKITSRLEDTSYQSMPTGYNASIDARGGIKAHYDLLSYAYNKSGNEYRRVGTWKAHDNVTTKGTLAINDNLVYWPIGNTAPVSVCSEPCQQVKGEIRIPDDNERLQFCCWTCKKCAYNEKIVNNTCQTCKELQIPTKARDACVILPQETVRFSDSVGIVILCFSFLGVIGATFTVFLFIYFYSSSIVKAAGRESSFIMLVGVYLCFIAPVVFLSEPSVVVCGIQRFIAGLSFSVIYAPLFLKTNRIFRIFQSAKTTTARPSLISPLSQVIISLGIILVQVLLGVIWIIGDHPTVEINFPKTNDKYRLFCSSDPYTMVLNLLICLAIMIACTYYAFRTRHFPKNYNETKSIMYTLYFSCFAWGVFFPTYLLSSNVESFMRTYTIAVFCNTIGFVSLIGFFGPKIHLLFRKSTVTDSPTVGTIILSQQESVFRKQENMQQIIMEEAEDQLPNSSDLLSNKGARIDATTQFTEISSKVEEN